jgi:hypothetical protein
MAANRFTEHGWLLNDSDPPDITTAGALYRAQEDARAPMPSFPVGSPAFVTPDPPTRPASAASNVEVVSDREMTALREAVPSASPSIIRVSTASLEAIRVAVPSPASSISDRSSHDSFTEYRVPADSHRSSDEDDTPSAVPQQFGPLPAVVRTGLSFAPHGTDATGSAELLAPVARGGLSRDTAYADSSHGSSSVTDAQWADVPGLTTIPDQGPAVAVRKSLAVTVAGKSPSVNASPGNRPSNPIELSADTRSPSVVVSHDVTYHTPPRLTQAETEITSSCLPLSRGDSLDGLITDKMVEDAREAMDLCMEDVNISRLGYAHYYLEDELRMVTDANPDITVPSENLRRVLDLATGVIGVGPVSTSGEDAGDTWHCLKPSAWFRASTALLASIVRGCVRTAGIHAAGDFPFDICLDKVQYAPGIDPPTTQANALRLLACQLLNELGRDSCTADFSIAEAAQLHDARFASYKAYVLARTDYECTVMGNQMTHLGLTELVNAASNEYTRDELLEIVREDLRGQVRGHYPVEMATLEIETRQEMDAELRERVERDAQATFDVALARRVAELMPDLEVAAQAKARALAKPLVSKYAAGAMDFAKHEAEERAKAHGKEHYATRAAAMKLHWDQAIANEEVDMVRAAAISLGIFPEVDPACVPRPAKKQRGEPRSVTATKATEEHRDRAAGPSGEKRKLDAPAVPALPTLVVSPSAPLTRPDQAVKEDPEPSSCPQTAEEDVSMRVLSLPPPELDASHLSDAHMDPQTRGVASSMHCPNNAMEDDVVALGGLGLSEAADDGVAPSPSTSAPPSLRIPDSTQDQAAAAVWKILSAQVDRRCAAMEAKVAAALTRLPSPPTKAPPPVGPPTAAAQPPAVRFADPPASRPGPPAARASVMTPAPPPAAPKPRGKAPAPTAPTPAPRVDDESSFPSLVKESEWTTVGPKGNKSKISFAGALGKPQHLTKTAMLHQQAAQTLSRHTQVIQGRTPAGHPRRANQARPVAPNTTEVTIIRFGGIDDDAMELAVKKRSPPDLVRDLQRRFAAAVAKPPKILSGRWAVTHGNFVLTFAGELSATLIFSYRHIVRSLFGEFVELCPVKGFTWAQLRGVSTMNEHGVIREDLAEELGSNPMFARTLMPVPPYFQVSPERIRSGTGTVIFAFIDDGGALTTQASRDGVCMYGTRVKYVHCGDKPNLIQCGRCHELGHHKNAKSCRVPRTAVRCVRCGRHHASADHDSICAAKTHTTAGVCNCTYKCLLCKQTGHDARSRQCPMRGDFAPPRLAVVQSPLTAPALPSRGPTPTSILPRPPRPASPSAVPAGPPKVASLARHSTVRARRVRPGKERARSASVSSANSWDNDIHSTPLSHSVPTGYEISDDEVRRMGDAAADRQMNMSSPWKDTAIAGGEQEVLDYVAMDRMGPKEAAADYARQERAREVSMRAFRAGGVAANDAGPNVEPALIRAGALGWTDPAATTLNAPIADYRGDLNQPLRDTPQTHDDV